MTKPDGGREIKFRAWAGKKMESAIGHEPGDLGITMINDFFKEDGRLFMQFTGLLDKNGKEIYEGDILDRGDGRRPFVIKWEEEYAAFQARRGAWNPLIEVIVRDSEIIGNIYESPELLKGAL